MLLRRLWATLSLIAILLGLACALVRIPDAEQSLAAQKAQLSRAIVYELRPGGRLDFAIEPDARVYRLVVHAARMKSLAPAAHDVELSIMVEGDPTRAETVNLAAPGTTDRVEAEQRGLAVGDPVAVNFQVRAQAGERMTIVLRSIRDADALLVRAYRDEKVEGLELVRRAQHVDVARGELFAERAGLVHWVDVRESDQLEILGSRWRKIAPLSDAREPVVSRAITLATAPVAAQRPHDVLLSVRQVEPGQSEAVVARGPNTMKCRAEGEPDTRVSATLRLEDGGRADFEGKGEIAVEVPAGKTAGVECVRTGAGPLSMRASRPAEVERPERIAFFRATSSRPVVVRAEVADLVVRVAARRPVSPSSANAVPIALEARIFNDSAPRRPPLVMTLAATSTASRLDRYEGDDPGESPTAGVTFHLLVPYGHSAKLRPRGSPVDLTLAELNVSGNPRTVSSYAAQERSARAAVVPSPRAYGDEQEYVARRPSNWQDFADDRAHGFVRVARHIVDRPVPEPRPPSFRVRRPKAPGAIAIGPRTFEPTSATFSIDVPKRGTVPLPVRVYAPEPVEMTVQVDRGVPRRRRIGAADHVTTNRRFAANREVRAFVMLGDDLQPGKHSVTFKIASGKKAWVHMPWVKEHRSPRPHWIESEFTR